jgi:hypothetical protein
VNVDWAMVFRQILVDGGDIVDISRALGERAVTNGNKYFAANVLREEYGLTVRETIAILSWLEGGVSDEELRLIVTLRR